MAVNLAVFWLSVVTVQLTIIFKICIRAVFQPTVVKMNVAVTGSPTVPTMVTGSPHSQPIMPSSMGAVRPPAPPHAENKVCSCTAR